MLVFGTCGSFVTLSTELTLFFYVNIQQLRASAKHDGVFLGSKILLVVGHWLGFIVNQPFLTNKEQPFHFENAPVKFCLYFVSIGDCILTI